MNFVDVQPDSFLDYAFTSPSTNVITSAKPSRTSRKQNRCCDQCRKGKRACDAAILEDALLDDTKAKENPTTFHYSDVFGPLAACSNCEKTKKTCTFDWLRSQRVAQSKETAASSLPPPKRRRTSSTKSSRPKESVRQYVTEPVCQNDSYTSGDLRDLSNPFDMGVTFADFASGISEMIDPTHTAPTLGSISPSSVETEAKASSFFLPDTNDEDEVLLDNDSGKGSSLETASDFLDDAPKAASLSPPSTSHKEQGPTVDTSVTKRVSRKKRRREVSPHLMSNNSPTYSTTSFATSLVRSTNNALLTDGLLKIYHSSFENALSCWVTERTCPYNKKTDVARISEARPNWNRIYHHVFRLDRLAANVRGRQLTFAEDQAAAKALNFAIYAFATQWAQSSKRCNSSYPFDVAESREKSAQGDSVGCPEPEFDRVLQINAWNEAHNALHAAGDIESFRVVLAQIVFALTQKPAQNDSAEQGIDVSDLKKEKADVDKEMDVCEDLLSKLNLAIADGPPTHLEQGLRLIHSLRSRVAMRNGNSCRASGVQKQYRCSAGRLDEADRATVDLLFWLGVMFDTLSSAMHNRPLVVSDEDSNIYPNGPEQTVVKDGDVSPTDQAESLWDGYLFAHQDSRLQATPIRWPCSFDQAAALLCDAAPVKVLLFRKVTTIQTLVTRGIRGQKIEDTLCTALDVVAHWTKLYAPFIEDCIQHHDQMHPRIQSWYTCLAGHWHLAALLLGDLIEIVDMSNSGVAEARARRDSTNFLANFRRNNCQIVSDMAARACPRADASFSQSKDFHFALNQGSILTEPWTAVLIRLFAKAGVILLEADTMLPAEIRIDDEDVLFQKADQCVRALWYLGRKSDMALAAANILGNALKDKRKGVEEKMSDMSTFLETELWHDLDDLDEAFDVDCNP
ncbi:hypothetical protein HBI23_172920 [Parastagonospora nodorum]|nr:hypothetical protein HBI47_159330 [Parastagonospora nodorum]KAH5649031.1 hypothetical protein HBI23_172920 [Parastagonospora nodorum]KAH6055519.1 hypothetical protein HBI67_193750 [Parastagonospora nodorum]KAH6064733.1 hypothetical protein HBI66_170100 [Parastagonospora nodorum]